ncbi:MAG: helix-turn-helix domain-containing protein [Candidatus Thiodiazotropha sp.]
MISAKTDTSSAGKLKRAALELFGKHGIHGVTVREIATAAGQKNSASIGYHFGSKEALIKELIVDGASLIDERRNQLLDAMDAKGGPKSIREIVEVMIYPSIGLSDSGEPDVYTRFLLAVVFDDRATFMSALEDRWNSGYQRCLTHLRKLMPNMPEEIKGQRFIFIEAYIQSVLAMREVRLLGEDHKISMWMKEDTMRHFIQTIVAILDMPYSEMTD